MQREDGATLGTCIAVLLEQMMEKKRLPPERRRTTTLRARVTSEEYGEITASSERAGLSLSEFVRRACLGRKIESRQDQQARMELRKINADLGRLGGLLKQAIASGNKEMIYGLLHKIDVTQTALLEQVRKS